MSKNHGSIQHGTELYSPEVAEQKAEKTATIHFAGKGPQKVKYVEIEGLAIMEGDIVIAPVEEIRSKEERDTTEDFGAEFTFVMEVGARWPDGIVPYLIDPALPEPERVLMAIEHWNTNTIIRLVPHTGETNHIRFIPGSGCSSPMGMQGGEQFITLGSDCTRGNAIHEIGHALGMYHEQSSPNRDQFVEIKMENIKDEAKFNFDKATFLEAGTIGDYDYNSIMHYGAFAFSKNGEQTIIPKIDVQIGQRNGLSELDIAGINALYGDVQDEHNEHHTIGLQMAAADGREPVHP
ncbi:M12 family metallopeptidase [Paenibacillus pinihumi]|uniref:M12 family metallopeptidase n=1 Tax=Paenibacillus pinihumi TaxID=669462 RepID=UPI000688271D|nr:M12 family metallopeptidase [Paenibacillus pinihumi]